MPFAVNPDETGQWFIGEIGKSALHIRGNRSQLRALADACLRAIETGSATGENGPGGCDIEVTRTEEQS
jgi:hypothetical protein